MTFWKWFFAQTRHGLGEKKVKAVLQPRSQGLCSSTLGTRLVVVDFLEAPRLVLNCTIFFQIQSYLLLFHSNAYQWILQVRYHQGLKQRRGWWDIHVIILPWRGNTLSGISNFIVTCEQTLLGQPREDTNPLIRRSRYPPVADLKRACSQAKLIASSFQVTCLARYTGAVERSKIKVT